MKIVKKVALVLCVLALPVMLATATLSTAVNSIWLYQYSFARYGVSQDTGISSAELDKAARSIINYWNNGDETVNITVIKDGQPFILFNAREVDHLVDVKALFHFMYKCLLGSVIYVLVFAALALFWWKDKRLLANGLYWGSGLSLLIMIILGLLSLTDFEGFFYQLHLLIFPNNNFWLLNPRTDYLMMLFPDSFWFDAAMICAAFMVFLSLVLGFVGWKMRKKKTA